MRLACHEPAIMLGIHHGPPRLVRSAVVFERLGPQSPAWSEVQAWLDYRREQATDCCRRAAWKRVEASLGDRILSLRHRRRGYARLEPYFPVSTLSGPASAASACCHMTALLEGTDSGRLPDGPCVNGKQHPSNGPTHMCAASRQVIVPADGQAVD